jgi:hypothetical protein
MPQDEMRNEAHGAKNNEVRDATKKERHVCARARGGEPAVSPFETMSARLVSIRRQGALRSDGRRPSQ